MPKVTITLPMIVTLDIPKEFASAVTRDDLVEMAMDAVPDSSTYHNGLPDGVQMIVNEKAQEDDQGDPVFADVHFVEHDITAEPEIEFDDDSFIEADRWNGSKKTMSRQISTDELRRWKANPSEARFVRRWNDGPHENSAPEVLELSLIRTIWIELDQIIVSLKDGREMRTKRIDFS